MQAGIADARHVGPQLILLVQFNLQIVVCLDFDVAAVFAGLGCPLVTVKALERALLVRFFRTNLVIQLFERVVALVANVRGAPSTRGPHELALVATDAQLGVVIEKVEF